MREICNQVPSFRARGFFFGAHAISHSARVVGLRDTLTHVDVRSRICSPNALAGRAWRSRFGSV
jgi:hypothetical protein